MSKSVAQHVPVLVASCDAYADVWQPFFDLFWRRWPDCPFSIYLGSNHRTFEHPRVNAIRTRDDGSWASCVRTMLDELNTSHVILLLDDFFLTTAVNSSDVVAAVNMALERDVDCLRLSPAPGTRFSPHELILAEVPVGVLARGAAYRVSCQPAVWRVETLRRYLVPGFTPWEFELLGTQMSEFRDDVFWSAVEPLIAYDHAIEKGRWKPDGIAICETAGVAVDTSKRLSFTAGELHTHYFAPTPANQASQAKNHLIGVFQAGKRAEGLRDAFRLIGEHPFRPQLWGIAAFGTLGPGPLKWLRRQQLRRRIVQSLRREPGSARSNVAEFVR